MGSILTLLGGTYTAADWFELVGAGLTPGSIYAMIALGYTMVYGILRMINFAHGEIFMAGAFGGYFAIIAMAQAGLLSENVLDQPDRHRLRDPGRHGWSRSSSPSAWSAIAYRPLRNSPTLVPLISAIGASLFLQYSFRGFFGSGHLRLPDARVPRAAGARSRSSACAGSTCWWSSRRWR